jgi:hypothetical protein
MDPNQTDDVDRLFARLEAAPPPPDLRGQVMVAVAARSRTRRRIGVVLAVASLVCMTLFSFLMGQQLGASGGLLVFRELVLDADLARSAPIDVALAAAELTPWAYLVPVLVGLVGIGFAGRALLRPAPRLGAAGDVS